MATSNLMGMATINISLRVVQRSVEEFTDILAKNPGLWVNVVDRKGNVLFVAKSQDIGDIKPYSIGDNKNHGQEEFSDIKPYVGGDKCDKCKKLSECRKWTEDGNDYKICAVCALKAKLPWHKLEQL